MKKALLTIAIVITAFTIQAQDIRLGINGNINSTWLMNKNVFDADDELDVASTFGGTFGVDAIYNFSEKAGISVGVNFISTTNQKYEGEDDGSSIDFESKVKLHYIDIPLLLRLTSSGGTYFEVGPQFSFLGKATEDLETTPSFPEPFNYTDKDVKASFEKTNIALVLGFGVDIDVTPNIFITTGLRLGYGFSDVTKEFDNETELSAADDEQDLAFPTYWAHYENANTQNGDEFKYEKTQRVFGGLHIGLSYKFSGSAAK
jgi:opacity protein-like surface antigen